jgi:predicted dehydrogenase
VADVVRLGVVGTSWYPDLVHLPVLTSYERARVVAICGRNRARAEEMAGKFGIPAAFTDFRAMIEAGNLDALVVLTPDDLHYPVTMDALDAGLHVLCEKSLATSAAQAREMYERAERAGVRHMVFFTYRWLPHQRYVRQLVEDGYVGRPYHCALRYVGD